MRYCFVAFANVVNSGTPTIFMRSVLGIVFLLVKSYQSKSKHLSSFHSNNYATKVLKTYNNAHEKDKNFIKKGASSRRSDADIIVQKST